MSFRNAVAVCVAAAVIGGGSFTASAAPAKKAVCTKAQPKSAACSLIKVQAIIGTFAKDPALIWCTTYFRLFVCYIGKLPKAAQKPTMSAILKSAQAFLKMSKGPAKASLAKSCRMATTAWAKAIRKVPKFKSCFKSVQLPKPTKKP